MNQRDLFLYSLTIQLNHNIIASIQPWFDATQHEATHP